MGISLKQMRRKILQEIWKEKNKERIAARQKLYYKANKEKIIEYSKAWYKANKKRCNKYSKENYRKLMKTHPNANAMYCAANRLANPKATREIQNRYNATDKSRAKIKRYFEKNREALYLYNTLQHLFKKGTLKF